MLGEWLNTWLLEAVDSLKLLGERLSAWLLEAVGSLKLLEGGLHACLLKAMGSWVEIGVLWSAFELEYLVLV